MIKMDIALTKMSSKGQIVLPVEIRTDIEEGEKLVIIKDGDRIIMKKASELSKQLVEDIEFARRTEEAWKRIEAGEGVEIDFETFIEEMEKW